MPRKLFVIHHSLRNFIVSSVLSSIVIIINTTIDGIVVSQAVSTDAISVVSLVTPVLTIVQLFGSMLFSGAALIVASAYGDQQYRKVNQLVTMSLTAVLIINGLLALVLSMFSGQIVHLLTNEQRLLPLVEDYLPYSLAACVCWLLCDAVGRYVKISGRPRLVTNYVILNAALNLLLDLLLVIWMGMDMKGAALASLIAPVVAMVVYVPYLSTPPKPFTFDILDHQDYVRHELDMGKETGQSGAFDVSLQNLQERLTVIIKDVGKAYNPPVSHQYCNDVNYQYLNGLNCLYLNFPKER